MNIRQTATDTRRAHPDAAVTVARFDRLLDGLERLHLHSAAYLTPAAVQALRRVGIEADERTTIAHAMDRVWEKQQEPLRLLGSWLR